MYIFYSTRIQEPIQLDSSTSRTCWPQICLYVLNFQFWQNRQNSLDISNVL